MGLLTGGEARALAPLALIMGARMLGLFLLLPVVAPYVVAMQDGSAKLAGLAVGVYGLTQVLMLVPMGWLSDRIGRRPVLVTGLLVFAAGGALAASVEHPAVVVVGRALQGLGAVSAVVMASVRDATSEKSGAQGMALVGVAVSAAFGLSVVVAVPLAAAIGVDGIFVVSAVLGVVAAMVALFAPLPAVVAQKGVGAHSVDVAVLPYCLGVFAIHFSIAALFVALPLALLGAGSSDAAWAIYLFSFLLSLVVAVPLIIRRPLGNAPLIGASVGLAVAAPLAVAMLPVAGPYAVAAALVLFFAGFNYLEAVLPSRVASLALPGGRGAVMGLYAIAQAFGVFAGGLVAGNLAGGYNLWLPMLVGAVLSIAWLPVLHYSSKLFKTDR